MRIFPMQFFVLLALVFAPSLGAASVQLQDKSRLVFDISLDDRRVGTHSVTITPMETRTRVDVDVELNVKLLFFSAYEYSHKNQEIWRDGCLESLSAKTNDDGEAQHVEGRLRDGSFVITEPSTRLIEDGCVRSFAYWNLELLRTDSLLNTQTGAVEEISLDELGSDLITIDGKQLNASRYRLNTPEGVIELWYDDRQRWLALSSRVKGDRVLRYERTGLYSDA